MHTHVSRSTTPSIWGAKYSLSIRLYADPDEVRILHAHLLTRVELWIDPLRDEYATAAAAAHDKAKVRGLLVAKMSDAASISGNEVAALYHTIRSLRAFNVRISDLLRGITITHRSLRALEDIATVLIEATDRVDAAVRAAQSYDDNAEELYAAGTEPDDTVRPADWTRTWRR